jgi:hypothetical protein
MNGGGLARSRPVRRDVKQVAHIFVKAHTKRLRNVDLLLRYFENYDAPMVESSHPFEDPLRPKKADWRQIHNACSIEGVGHYFSCKVI